MPPSKVRLQCKAIVPIRQKVCKSCEHVFRAKRRAEHTPIVIIGAYTVTHTRMVFAHVLNIQTGKKHQGFCTLVLFIYRINDYAKTHEATYM